MDQSKWEKFYQNTPLEKIPWQRTPADFLTNLIDFSEVEKGLALDLGCGTGMQSIFLAKKGFKVTGVDISPTAINYAKENAKRENVDIDFVVHDATDLGFLQDKKFDLVLDWTNLHGIPEEKVEQYIQRIIDHLKIGGKLILRCFGRQEGEERCVEMPMGVITRFTRGELEGMFGQNFRILKEHTSEPNINDKMAPGKFFHELLMERM